MFISVCWVLLYNVMFFVLSTGLKYCMSQRGVEAFFTPRAPNIQTETKSTQFGSPDGGKKKKEITVLKVPLYCHETVPSVPLASLHESQVTQIVVINTSPHSMLPAGEKSVKVEPQTSDR